MYNNCIGECSFYLPSNVLSPENITQDIRTKKKRVANFDEDSLTMAVEVCEACLSNYDKSKISTLYFATNTSPYIIGPSASIIASALGLSSYIKTAEFGGGFRASTSAVISAMNERTPSLIVASDVCSIEAGSDIELSYGDGAGALVLCNEKESNVIASIKDIFSITDTFEPLWIGDSNANIEDSKLASKNYFNVLEKLLKKLKIQSDKFSYWILPSWDGKAGRSYAKLLKVDKNKVFDSEIGTTGHLGSANSIFLLIKALSISKPKDLILWTNYAGGIDAFVIEVKKPLAIKISFPERQLLYSKYLAYKGIIKNKTKGEVFTSSAILYREKELILSLCASECCRCKNILTLPLTVCPKCNNTKFNKKKLKHTGKVFSFTHEYYVPSLSPPVTMAIIDLDEGGRILTQITETTPDKVKTGSRVKLVFRKFHEAGGFPNYHWKAKLI